VQSFLSLIPSARVIPTEYLGRNTLQISTGLTAVNSSVNEYLAGHYYEGVSVRANLLEQLTAAAGWIWLAGLLLMGAWAIFSHRHLSRQVAEAVPEENGVWLSHRIGSPFVLGLLRPRIYLPVGLPAEDAAHVIAHERAHIRRRDHWWKPLGFLLLAVYWFHPLLWAAYLLLCRDIELACDEAVIRTLGGDAKADYSRALLHCAARPRAVAACPLAFGEVGVKERIARVLRYRKPAVLITVSSLVVCAVAAVCFLTDPHDSPIPADPQQISAQQDQVSVCMPILSSEANVFTDAVVVERVRKMLDGLDYTPVSDGQADVPSWLMVELTCGGEKRTLFIDKNGRGIASFLTGSDSQHLQFAPGTYDYDYLWALCTARREGPAVPVSAFTARGTAGALLYQNLSLSYLPLSGSDRFAGVTEEENSLTVQTAAGESSTLSHLETAAFSRRALLALLRKGDVGTDLTALVPETVTGAEARVYGDGEYRLTVWELTQKDSESILWLGEGDANAPLRLYELLDTQDTFPFHSHGILWTFSKHTRVLPIRFDGITPVTLSVTAGTLSYEPDSSTLSTLSKPTDTVYWTLPQILPEEAALTFAYASENGDALTEAIQLRRLSRSESLFGYVSCGLSLDWLGLASSRLHTAVLSADSRGNGLCIQPSQFFYTFPSGTGILPSGSGLLPESSNTP